MTRIIRDLTAAETVELAKARDAAAADRMIAAIRRQGPEEDRGNLVELIDSLDLCCPEVVADEVLSAYDRDGWDAAIAEVELAVAADACAAKGLGIK